MPDISTKATVGIELNTQPVGRKIAELESKMDNLIAKKKQFEAAGDQKGLVKIQKEINKVSRQLDTARTASERCKAALSKLNEASPKELRHTLKQLKADLDHMERGSAAWKSHVEAIKKVKREIKLVDEELREHEGLMSRINRKVNEWGMSIASAAAAFTGLIFTARQAVQAYADMEAEMANVRKFTGMTADEVVSLNEAFKSIDTRTSREDLNKLAQEAGRLGLQSQEDVLGFVNAANQINVALDDLGEGATLTLSKLTDIFGDKERLGVEQSLLAVGSVINELSQNCTASAPYLAQFAQRLAGVGKQANMTIPQIMGFAAVLDSQGQAVEMSATALSQLIMKMFQDPAKIAKATGIELKAFNKVLKEDTNEALLMLLDRLNQLGDLSVLAPVFDAMGTDGARASQVIAALAGNVANVRWEQSEANKAFKEGTSVTKEYNVQNNTVQAQLDKAKKGFHEMAVQLGEKLAPAMKYAITGTSAMMKVLSGLVSFISSHKATIVSLAIAIGAYTLAVKGSTITTTLWSAAQKATHGIMGTVKAIVIGVKYVYYLLTDQLRKANVAQKAFNTTVKANPYGIALAAISMLIGGIVDYVQSITEAKKKTAEAQKEMEEWKASLIDVGETSAEYCSGEITRLKALYKEATNESLSRNKRIEAANKLQEIYPTVFGNLSTEAIMTGAAATAYDNLTQSIINSARARAAAAKIEENEKEILALEATLEKQKADAVDKRIKADKDAEKARQTKEKNKGEIESAALGDSRELNSRNVQTLIKENRKAQEAAAESNRAATEAVNAASQTLYKIGKLNEANDTLAKKYDLAAIDLGKNTTNAPSPITGFKPVDEKEAKKAAAEAAKQARIAAALEKKEFKEAKDIADANLTKQLNDAKEQYKNGEIDYEAYLNAQLKAQEEHYEAASAIYKKHNIEDSEAAAEVKAKWLKSKDEIEKNLKKLKTERLAYERDKDKIAANMEFYNPDNTEAYKNQRVLDEKLAQINLEYLRKFRDEQRKDSQEYVAADQALKKAEMEEELRKRKQMETDLSAWLYIYSQKGAKDRMNSELAVVDELLKQERIKVKEAEEAKAAIRKKYRDEINSKTGTKSYSKNDGYQDFADAKDTYKKQMAALEDAYKQGLIAAEDYKSRKWQIEQNYHKKVVELIKGEGSEWATMVTTLVETWKAGFENIGSTVEEKLETIAAMASSAFAIMNSGLNAYKSYMNEAREVEVKNAEAAYDEKIKRAQKLNKSTKKLEEDKENEIAKIKKKYNDRAMAIEIAQAISSTALAAINAYASASKVSWVLGPIAAGMALASGAIQIATIKKQHKKEGQGFYEGGFTSHSPNNRREVGVVHANEFVANHKAVANPQLLPVLQMIDQAQRNNTVGSLTKEDVSRAIGQGTILGEVTAANQRTVEQHDTSMVLVAASMERQTAAIDELNARLADGIESFMVMDGERGFERKWERYQRMKNNPKR